MTTAVLAKIERADASTVSEAVPLLLVQLEEHGIDIGAHTFAAAVRGLVEVPGRGAVLLARSPESGEVIGVAVLAHTWTIEHGGPSTWLDELYVVPALRAKGIGTALLHRAIETARADGCRAVDLEVDADHARVESLYQREGFRPLRRRHFTRALV
jgi:GNAT superfamily N-acetyltransferase